MGKELRKQLIEIKEQVFYIIFMYGIFDLNAMMNFNIIFNNILNKFIKY